eukprot:8771285-Prorocentrum_lima.AAC.1
MDGDVDYKYKSKGLTSTKLESDIDVLKAGLREDGGEWHVVQRRRATKGGHQAAKWSLAARVAAVRAVEYQRDERAKARQAARVAALK